jgi:bd-type cytochrome oxidase subunit I
VRALPSTGGALNDFFFARSQMGMSLAFHIVFAVIGMAMSLLMAVSEGCYWGHSSIYKKLYAKRVFEKSDSAIEAGPCWKTMSGTTRI